MEQRSLLIIMLCAIVMIFGGLIAYDVISNNRIGNLNGDRSNWNWTDDWTTNKTDPQVKPNDPTPEVKPEQPQQEEQPKPQQQIVAENYQDAIKKSGEMGMPVLVLFEADWCGWCKKMKQETLSNEKVKEALRNYIIVTVNTDTNKDIVRKHGVRGLPSQLITNVREEKLKFGSGYQDANAFVQWLNNPNLYKQPKK